MTRPKFRFIPLTADCQDCMFRVGDSNGALVVSQLEAHAINHPDHTVHLSSREHRETERTPDLPSYA